MGRARNGLVIGTAFATVGLGAEACAPQVVGEPVDADPSATMEVTEGTRVNSEQTLETQCATITVDGVAKVLQWGKINSSGASLEVAKIALDSVEYTGDCGPEGWVLVPEPMAPNPGEPPIVMGPGPEPTFTLTLQN